MIVRSMNRVGYGSVGGNVGYTNGGYGYAYGDDTPVAVTPTPSGTAGVIGTAVPGILNAVLDLIGLKPKPATTVVVPPPKTPTWMWVAAGAGALVVGGVVISMLRRKR